MNNLARYENNGIELIIDTQTGESFATPKGYSRMSNVPESTIKSRVSKIISTSEWDDCGVLKQAEIPTQQGMRMGRLLTEYLISDWIVEDNPKIAKQLLKLGVRVYLHKLAGFEVQSTAVSHQIPQTYAEALLEAGRLALENEKLQSKIEKDAPLVAYAEAVQFSDDSVDFNAYAKMIGTGRTRLFRAMREYGIIMKNSTLPFQKWIDAGYFEVSQEIDTNDGKLIPFALVTGKGQIWLKQRLDYFANIEKRAINAIASEVAQLSIFSR